MSHDPNCIVVALDFSEPRQALALADQLDPSMCRVKVGKELFTRAGPQIVEQLMGKNFDVFLDLKFHDIPNTVAGACRAAADLNCWMINVHASGGRAMMEAAANAIAQSRSQALLIAVTILTSLDAAAIAEVGLRGEPKSNVENLARLAESCGLDGVVCSPQELQVVRKACQATFLTVTPGVRPAAAASDDQRRVATPQSARADGANYLVVGRPITQASDPLAALQAIASELA